ncbi:HAD family hydrolase [Radiobacillus sp. PE A8.2]|uniref:HAD family hydrolase n=1 Tax=Radiobacillus sp. PE A8.2 TaxID=3380349 RepID=UPI00388FA223
MLKLFVTDLDGTFLETGTQINPKDAEAVQQLKKQGISFAIATGRMDRDIVEVLKEIQVDGHRISQNGGFVYDTNGKQIHGETFDFDLGRRIHKAISTHSSYYSVTTADEVYVPKKTEQMKEIEHLLYFPLLEDTSLASSYRENFSASKFSIHGDTEEIVAIMDQLATQFKTEAECYLSDKHCVDFVPKGISKALGVQRLIVQLGLNTDEIAVIGDSFNDVPMLEMTPNSYAMADAHPDVQKKANKVVGNVHEAIADLKAKGLM